MRPAIVPISKPPILASISIGSFGSGLFKAIDSSMTEILCCLCSSSMPVPGPVSSATGFPVSTAAMAVLGVVLPIPISPVPKMSTSGASVLATSTPASTAMTAWVRLMAGPRRILAVPLPIFLERMAPFATRSVKGSMVPASTTQISAPA